MRQVSIQSATALKNGKRFSKGNTMVRPIIDELLYGLYLHDNLIAKYDVVTGQLFIYDCRWQSVTTKERLNTILHIFGVNAGIYQKDYTWYLSAFGTDVLWTGEYDFAVSNPLVNV